MDKNTCFFVEPQSCPICGKGRFLRETRNDKYAIKEYDCGHKLQSLTFTEAFKIAEAPNIAQELELASNDLPANFTIGKKLLADTSQAISSVSGEAIKLGFSSNNNMALNVNVTGDNNVVNVRQRFDYDVEQFDIDAQFSAVCSQIDQRNEVPEIIRNEVKSLLEELKEGYKTDYVKPSLIKRIKDKVSEYAAFASVVLPLVQKLLDFMGQ